MSPPRGKGWVIHDWGLVRTCAEILKVSIGMSFGVFLQFLLYLLLLINFSLVSTCSVEIWWFGIINFYWLSWFWSRFGDVLLLTTDPKWGLYYNVLFLWILHNACINLCHIIGNPIQNTTFFFFFYQQRFTINFCYWGNSNQQTSSLFLLPSPLS